jgi:hypothetical protein
MISRNLSKLQNPLLTVKWSIEIAESRYEIRRYEYPKAVKQVEIFSPSGLGLGSDWLFDEDGKLIAIKHYD